VSVTKNKLYIKQNPLTLNKAAFYDLNKISDITA